MCQFEAAEAGHQVEIFDLYERKETVNMSGHDADEDLKDRNEIQVFLSVQWSEDVQPQSYKKELQKILLTWTNKLRGEYTILNVSEDGSAVIKIKPAAAVSELQKLSRQKLKGKDGTTVTITSISLTPPEPEAQIPDDASMDFPLSFSSEPQHVNEQICDMNTCTCDIPILHYWYVNQAYKREIERIEKESGGKIMAEMKLTFEPHQKDGNPNFAFSEFINLVQKCSAESSGFTFPLRKVNPEGLKNTMEIIQRPENKLWIALSSEDMTVCGPRESQDAIRKSLNAEDKTLIITHTPAGRFIQTSQKTSLKTAFSSEQPSTSHDECAETLAMSERKETDNMSGSDTFEEMETDQTEQPQNAMEDSTHPNTSAGETTQVQVSYVSQSDIRMDVQLYGQQGQHQYPMGNSSNPAQNNFTNPHPSAGQLPQAYQYPPVNMPNQGQQLHAMRGPYNPAQNNCTNLHPSAGQFPQVLQKTSMNTEVDKGHFWKQSAISRSLNAAPTSSANTYNSAPESQVRSLNIGMSINDRLVNNGLNMQESHWKLMTASYSDDINKIKIKFGVNFKDSGVLHGKVSVKAHYKRSGGNASMESHAVRALLHLCQKIATSPKNITQHRGATGLSGSLKRC
ncbi:uncharacterized protein LOC119021069 isoform X2 [Acanthopagrus latus]|uniref:uncharacterized protein LOC119021069 isoform X2 n=1 Tax=Acanthopagrus latus TaxID=8177 RepID=UPI00187C6B4E|nr:uncharacterized protein LOC119021069 isoform X2 [Acanthopagrus latus]